MRILALDHGTKRIGVAVSDQLQMIAQPVEFVPAEPFAAFLARFRAHLGLVEKAMGGLLVLTGVAFLTGAISEMSYWLLDTFPMLGKIG